MPTQSPLPVWDLKQLYKNFTELDWHVEQLDALYQKFAKKYKKDERYLSDPRALKKALEEREKLLMLGPSKPYMYLKLSADINSEDKKVQAKLNQVLPRLTDIWNQILFFDVALKHVPKKQQQIFLKSPELKKYHRLLEVTFDWARHTLSDKEEILLNKKRQTSYHLWTQGVTKARNQQEIKWKGKILPLTEALETLSMPIPVSERRKLWRQIIDVLRNVSTFAESEINAVILDKKLEDELRGFKIPYESTLLECENTEDELLSLVDAVTGDFSTSHAYYKLKKQILGLNTFEYVDRLAPVGKVQTRFDFESSARHLRAMLEGVDPQYAQIFAQYLNEKRIDAKIRRGKKSGGYCWSAAEVPVFVFLNHTNTFESYMTLAHEMGHAFHYEKAKQQPLTYQDYTTSVAEVASTFFENLAFDSVFKELSEKEQVYALHDRLDRTMATIYRQIAFFNFELELHTKVRNEGFVQSDDIAKLLQRHMKAYVGNSAVVTEEDGYSYIYWSHLRTYFYTYSYAYGDLISAALYQRYKEDPAYIKKVEQFLSAGSSKTPYQIFRDIGIDTRHPSFWAEGLAKISEDVKQLEQLARKAGMIKK